MSSINVSFMKRVVCGPYEHEEMSVVFQVESQDLLEVTTQTYREFVYRTLGKTVTSLPTTTSTVTTPETNQTQGETHGQGNKESSSKKSISKGKSRQENKQEEVTTTASASTEEMEEVPSPFKSAEPPKAEEPKKAKAEGKKKTDEGIPYDSQKDEHKSTMSNYLTKLTGGKEWAKDKEKSKKISREILHGQPFLAKDGSILPSFEQLCKDNFGVAQDVL